MSLIQNRLLFLGTLLVSGLSLAADINMNPGMWSWTSQMEMPGMSTQMPPMTHTECITKENMVPSNNDPSKECQVQDVKMSSSQVSWRVICKTPGGESSGEGVMNYSGNTASGEMHFTSQGMQMNMTMSGQRTGACQ